MASGPLAFKTVAGLTAIGRQAAAGLVYCANSGGFMVRDRDGQRRAALPGLMCNWKGEVNEGGKVWHVE